MWGSRCHALHLLLLTASAAAVQASSAVAVVDLEGRNVPLADAQILSDRLRHELVALGAFTVVERGEMNTILSEQGFQHSGCTSQECVVEMGQLLGATEMVAGSVGKLGNLYMLTVRLIDVGTATVVRAAEASVEGAIEELVKTAIPSVARTLSGMAAEEAPQGIATQASEPPPEPVPEGMVWVPPGTFPMGTSTATPLFGAPAPLHDVTLDGFFMDTSEVTQEAYRKTMGTNPSKNDGCDKCPVEDVTWADAKEYCRRMGKRLPTEAEWERACKAGARTDYPWGASPDMLADHAWYTDNASVKVFGGLRTSSGPRPVGQKKPNAYGLYDMLGNVFEITADYWDRDYYETSPRENPTGPATGTIPVWRGGWVKTDKAHTNCVSRFGGGQRLNMGMAGFRCARSAGRAE